MASRDGIPNLSRDQVIARLRECGCADVAPYAALLRHSIWMRVDPTRPPGLMESRFGGPAMMPDGFVWPTYTAEPYLGRDPDDDRETFVLWYAKQQQLPMFLLAQLNLAGVPVDSPLPREGLLSIFTDPFDGVWGHSKSDRQGFRVTYIPPEHFASLRPHDMPDRTGHRGAFANWTWPTYRIEYLLKWNFANWDAVQRLAEGEPYRDVFERVQEAMGEIRGYSFGHFLLDAGMNHQNDPRESGLNMWDQPGTLPEDATCEQTDVHYREVCRRAQAEWTCFFSITKDEHLNPVVGGTGGLSFVIRKTDLAERRFDRAWIVRS